MGTIFAYSITVSLILTLGYGGYLLSQNGSAKMRRTVLLGIYALGLIITPALLTMDFSPCHDAILERTISTNDVSLPAVIIPTGSATSSVIDILLKIYVGGVIICTILTLVELFRVLWLMLRCKKEKIEGHTVYTHDRRDIGPFSIGRIMVINRADTANLAIMKHESSHIALHHSVDLCIAQLTAIICWYCPAIWHLRRELKLVHEFQADEAVLCDGTDLRIYCRLLVERAASLKILAIANSLTHKNLKQRIKMMQTPKNERHRSKSRALLPFATIVCGALLLSVPTVSNAIDKISQSNLHAHVLDTTKAGGEKAFAVYGVDINQKAVKKGNFILVSELESGNVNAKDIDGVIFPRIGAVICTDKKIMERLLPKIRKYIVDGKVMSAKEFSRIPAKNLSKVIVSGNSMNVYTRNLYESQRYDVILDAFNAEYK